ncbi:MAG TPA: hypothetical protein VFG24_00735 [Nitrosopumilaceae archaeon]|nr:hypothetical protein [Nitrosopumilaceae archaeon]
MSIITDLIKNHAETLSVLAKCKTKNCQFNGIVLISKKKPREESLKDNRCPFCNNLGHLELVLYV